MPEAPGDDFEPSAVAEVAPSEIIGHLDDVDTMQNSASLLESDSAGDSTVPNGSAFFAAQRVFEQLSFAVSGAQSAMNLAEVLRVRTVLLSWDAMVLDEQGRGRVVRSGGLQEKAFATHLAVLLNISPRGAMRLLHQALAVRELPATWAGFDGGAFPWRAATTVSDGAVGLAAEELAEFDRQAAELAVDLPPHQLAPRLERLRDRLDAEAAARRREQATRARSVSATPEPDGQGALVLHGPQTDIAAMYDAVHQAAIGAHGRMESGTPLGGIMFDIAADLILHGAAHPPEGVDLTDPSTPSERLGDLRVPERKAVEATLLVVVPAATACGVGREPADLAGWGALAPDEAAHVVAHTTHWTRVAVDAIEDAVIGIDSTERYIPTGLRKLLQIRDRTCQGPGCNRPAHRCDVDHTIRWEHGGHASELNLRNYCRPHHEMKDAGYMDVRIREDGALVWRTRWGATRVTRPPMTVRPAPPPRVLDDDPPPF